MVLQEEDQRHKKIKTAPYVKYPENVNTLKFEALHYLNGTACATQSAEQIAALKKGLAECDLTKAEVLQIINLRPKRVVELHLIIEECEERFEMEDLEYILDEVKAALPRADDDKDDEGGDMDEEEDGEGEMDIGMFYDLNIALPESAGKAGGVVSSQDWAQVAQAVERARALGYQVVALNQTISTKLAPGHLAVWKAVPEIKDAECSWSRETGARVARSSAADRVAHGRIRVLRRLTVVVSDAAQSQSLTGSGGAAAGEYDVVAVRPTSDKLLAAASSGAWEAVDMISLDMGGRWGYFVKHKTAGQALAAGLALELSYQPALADSATRQQWVSNAASIVRVTRGRGLVWTSAARQASDLRSPYDVTVLGEVLQLNADLSKRALSSSSRATLVHAFTRTGTLRAVISAQTKESSEGPAPTKQSNEGPAPKRAKNA
ncbi:RNA-binding RNA processing protein rpp1 [Coemansia sp. RSA 1836]|nr:RNA-binding RNA processing protein rpp1 [Coemansia sp. RSA 1836]